MALFSLLANLPMSIRRTVSKTHSIAIAILICLAVQTLAAGVAWGAPSTTGAPVNKAALNKAVQEALAKAQAGQGPGGAGAPGAPGAAGAGAGAAGGAGTGTGGQGFSELTKKAEEEPPNTQTTATTSNSTSSPLTAGLLIPIAIVAVGLLAGIAFLILRDARGVTPVGDLLGSPGNAEARAARLRKRRAKAKAAKRQRKRNR